MKKLGIIFLDFLVISLLVYLFLFVFGESHYLDRISENRKTAIRVVTWGYCIATALYIFIAHRQSLILTSLAVISAYLSLGVAMTKEFSHFIFHMTVTIVIINLVDFLINWYRVLDQFLASSFEEKKTLFQATQAIPLEVALTHERLKQVVGQEFHIGKGKGKFKVIRSFEDTDEVVLLATSFWLRILLLFDMKSNTMKIHSLNGIVDYQIKKGLQVGIEHRIRGLG